MSVLNENTIIGASAAGGDYEIEQSLRFNDDDTASLSRTPSVAGNQKTWTLSCWVKRGDLSNLGAIFEAATSGNVNTILYWNGSTLYLTGSTSTYDFVLSQVFRDASAWYHLIIAMDTTQATASNRTKIYINGSIVTAFATETYPSLNLNTTVNSTIAHSLGKRAYDTSLPWDGYMAEVNFIDGQALTPDSFGETGDYGEWKPLKYTGTYGTNGFYLPFEQDYAVEGFSTVTYEGNGATQYIGGVGFQPDLVWSKARSAAYSHILEDAIRGAGYRLNSNATSAEALVSTSIQSFDSDGYTLGTSAGINENAKTFVAWNWDMGGTTASNTSGSITSSVRASTTYGQSIVSWTGDGGTGNVGHGLGSTPDLIIQRRAGASASWSVQHHEMMATSTGKLLLESTDGVVASSTPAMFNATSTRFDAVYTNAVTMIAYCFHSVTGYSKFGSYTGNATADNAVTTGFTPAFLLIKRTDATGDWMMFDNARNPTQPDGGTVKALFSNTSGVESDTYYGVQFTATGFNLQYNDSSATNASGGTYIYAAFADTREYAYWYDQSGNNNDWTSEGGLTESDVMVDSPTNNFATLNAVEPDGASGGSVLSEGNLKSVTSVTNGGKAQSTFMIPSTGKWYAEIYVITTGSSPAIGVCEQTTLSYPVNSTNAVFYYGNGNKWVDNTQSSYGASFAATDIVAVTMDADAGSIQFYKNNAAQGSISHTLNDMLVTLTDGSSSSSLTTIMNFGADSSFAGNKTPQGNQDANGIGDFYYAPPTGYLALCTANLPSVDVIPSEHFNPVLYTGNGSTQSIAVGFQPDFTWIKGRSGATAHLLQDTMRGTSKYLISNSTNGDGTLNDLITSFNSNGVSLGTNVNTNANTATYVAWNWKAGGSAVSNTNGTITSSVSANPSAGFSIVSYTGQVSVPATIGHGLSSAPEMIIVKNRDRAVQWPVYHADITALKYLQLDSTTDEITSSTFYNTAPTSTVFTAGSSYAMGMAVANEDVIAYCFHSVDGYSKVGSYTGNGSADGTFVHCGFRPAYVMVKRTDAANNWIVHDIARDNSNVVSKFLYPNLSNEEGVADNLDITSNGFKLRSTATSGNASGGTYIFLAFAESPFKHTNAR